MSTNLEFLSTVSLFSNLEEEDLRTVAAEMREASFSKDEVVFPEEETGHYIYVVRTGQVRVTRRLPSGQELVVAYHGPGEHFGEMGAIDGRTARAVVTAMEPTTILYLTSRQFQPLLSNPLFMRALLETVCSHYREAWSQIEVLSFRNAEARVRAALYNLSIRQGSAAEGGILVGPRVTHQALADLAGVSRETATRVLRQLRDQGLVRLDNRRFLVANPEALLPG